MIKCGHTFCKRCISLKTNNPEKKKKDIKFEMKMKRQEETRKREFKPLMKIKDNYPKYIITEDITDYSKQGIINLNIIDFLKDESI